MTAPDCSNEYVLDEDRRQGMLDELDLLRRKVETGEMIGMIVMVTTRDWSSWARTLGVIPDANGVLLLQDIAEVARRKYMALQCEATAETDFDFRKPAIGVLDEDDG